MVSFRVINVLVIFMVVLSTSSVLTSYASIPEVTFEVLKNGGFRAYIPDIGGVSEFKIKININTPPTRTELENLVCITSTTYNDFFMIESKKKLNENDSLYYWVGLLPVVRMSDDFYLTRNVTELLDSYQKNFPYQNVTCEEILFADYFLDSTVNTDKWLIEHKIPTYTGPRFVFNSYINSPETIFIQVGILYLQPIPLLNERDVRGTLNLGSSCTSNIPEECVYTQQSTFLLPPVKSAMLRSKRTFRYGKFEIRAKLPAGDWIFPVIQLSRPTTDHESVDELWIAYSRGNKIFTGQNNNRDLGSHLLFAGPVESANEPQRSSKLVSYRSRRPFSDRFHTYKLHWYPDKFQFFVDDELYEERNSELGSFGDSENNLEYEFHIGVGIGGLIDFPDGYGNKPWNNTERNYIKKFFEDMPNSLKTWNDGDTILMISDIKVTAL